MRGQDGQLKLRLKDMLNMWKDYCEELLNKENPWVCEFNTSGVQHKLAFRIWAIVLSKTTYFHLRG